MTSEKDFRVQGMSVQILRTHTCRCTGGGVLLGYSYIKSVVNRILHDYGMIITGLLRCYIL